LFCSTLDLHYLCTKKVVKGEKMRYSIIIPVFNRPDEVNELLESLEIQNFRDFEVLVVEDGSTVTCADVVEKHADKLDVHYFFKPNSGPGQSRNYGAVRAEGEYLIILDSDCVLPEAYLDEVDMELMLHPCAAFGGPDRAHSSFTPTQKAISYSMTSFFTTGGIRGGKKKMDKFYPRSFNMGIRADVYKELGGFSKMRFGEDIDLSIRIFKGHYTCRLFPEAWVWHKRRTDMKKFFKQVHNSGIARINLYKKYPDSLKLVHLLPMVFTVGTFCLLVISIVGWFGLTWNFQMIHHYPYAPDFPSLLQKETLFRWLAWLPLAPLALYALLVCVDSTLKNHSLNVGLRSIGAAFVQLIGYGTGFLRAWWQRCVRGKDEFSAFNKNFYK
jgi:glycosyltransferase involved in cell wall biosynthesis